MVEILDSSLRCAAFRMTGMEMVAFGMTRASEYYNSKHALCINCQLPTRHNHFLYSSGTEAHQSMYFGLLPAMMSTYMSLIF